MRKEIAKELFFLKCEYFILKMGDWNEARSSGIFSF